MVTMVWFFFSFWKRPNFRLVCLKIFTFGSTESSRVWTDMYYFKILHQAFSKNKTNLTCVRVLSIKREISSYIYIYITWNVISNYILEPFRKKWKEK